MQTLRRQKRVIPGSLPIVKFERLSLIDWPGKLCAVIHVPGCNFRCPYCYNGEMIMDYIPMPKIPESDLISVLHPRVTFLDGVCVTGCEPLVHRELFAFLMRLKSIKTNVKLDTNGSYPKRLIALIMRGYVDYVAMDVKVQPERYRETVQYNISAGEVMESIQQIRRSGVDYEFKTTMVPGLVSEKDLKDIVILLAGSKRFTLQRFKPGNTLSKEYLEVKPYSETEMKSFLDLATPYFGEVRLI